jgi:hypothetical protein
MTANNHAGKKVCLMVETLVFETGKCNGKNALAKSRRAGTCQGRRAALPGMAKTCFHYQVLRAF